MKRLTRFVCFALVAAMLLATPAHAAFPQDARASHYFVSSSVYLDTVSGNTFDVCFAVTATGIMDELGASVIIIQRRASESDPWQPVSYYYPSSYPQMIDYGQGTHAASVRFYGSAGYEYRAYVELYAKNSRGEGYMPAYAY